jgi:hypothetical protein
MKRFMFLVFIFILSLDQSVLKAQNLTVRETVDSINTLLKANPYVDNFLEISIYYSVDISSNNELVVIMESQGSFKTVFKVKIADLEISGQKDFCTRMSNTFSWYCKPADTKNKNSCVSVEGTMPGGAEANYHQDNITVMFSNRNQICGKLNSAFNNLFIEVTESESK